MYPGLMPSTFPSKPSTKFYGDAFKKFVPKKTLKGGIGGFSACRLHPSPPTTVPEALVVST